MLASASKNIHGIPDAMLKEKEEELAASKVCVREHN
jgi:hypothetical protein